MGVIPLLTQMRHRGARRQSDGLTRPTRIAYKKLTSAYHLVLLGLLTCSQQGKRKRKRTQAVVKTHVDSGFSGNELS